MLKYRLSVAVLLLGITPNLPAQFEFQSEFPLLSKSDVAATAVDKTRRVYFAVDAYKEEVEGVEKYRHVVRRYDLRKSEIDAKTGHVNLSNLQSRDLPLPYAIEQVADEDHPQEQSYGIAYDEEGEGTLFIADSKRVIRIHAAASEVPQLVVREYAVMTGVPAPREAQDIVGFAESGGAAADCKKWERPRTAVNFLGVDGKDLFIVFNNGDVMRLDSNTLEPFNIYSDLQTGNSEAVIEHPFFEPKLISKCNVPEASASVISTELDLFFESYLNLRRANSTQPKFWQFPFEFRSGCMLKESNVLLLGDNTGRVFKLCYDADSWYFLYSKDGFSFKQLNAMCDLDDIERDIPFYQAFSKITPDVAAIDVLTADTNGHAYGGLSSLTNVQSLASIAKFKTGTRTEPITYINSAVLTEHGLINNNMQDIDSIALDEQLGLLFVCGTQHPSDIFSLVNLFLYGNVSQPARVARLSTGGDGDLRLEKIVPLKDDQSFKDIEENATIMYRDRDGREMLLVGVENPAESVAVMRPYEAATTDYQGSFILPGSVGYLLDEETPQVQNKEVVFATTKGRLKSRLAIWDNANPNAPYGTVPVHFYLSDDVSSIDKIESEGIFVGIGLARVGKRTFTRISGPNFDVRIREGEKPPFKYFVAVVDPANAVRETNDTNNIAAGRINYLPVLGKY